MIRTYRVTQSPIDEKFRVTEDGDVFGFSCGGSHSTPTKAFLYGLRFLDRVSKEPFVVEYLKKEAE